MIDFEKAKEHFRYDSETGDIYRMKLNKHYPKSLKINSKSGNLSNGYLITCFNSKIISNHRLAWFLHYDKQPIGVIDHINGNKLDNRIVNLRDVSHRENLSNQAIHRNGKLVGNYYDKSRKHYVAQIEVEGKMVYLGKFETETAAHDSYLKAVQGYTKAPNTEREI